MGTTSSLSLEAQASALSLAHITTPKQIEKLQTDLKLLKQLSFQRVESIEHRAERYISRLTVSVDHLRKMVDSFVHELEVGLLAHYQHPLEWVPSECSFKMLDAHIPSLPTGDEKGVYYALDFGGSTFRVIRAVLKGEGKIIATKMDKSLTDDDEEEKLSKGLLSADATATQLFDFFANTVNDFIKTTEDTKIKGYIQCGFTFSFPCSQHKINQAILMNWTKGFATGRATDDPVEGLDVVELMNAAFQRNKVPVRCNSVINDTVGTLLACSYSLDKKTSPPCLIGLILGTGMNCCYYDETAPQYGYQGKIINLECGNFNRDLPRINVDCELDFKSIETRGSQQIEKMCSGAYLGEICRLVVVRILAEEAPPMAWQAYSLSTETLARIVTDRSKEYIITYKIITECWQAELPTHQLGIIQRVATAIMERSAALASVLIIGCAKKTGRLQPAFGGLTVGIDGSLYVKNSIYRENLRRYVNEILGDELGNLINLTIASDGSGEGAVVLASTIQNII